VTADKKTRGSGDGKTAGDDARKPVSKPLLVVSWLVPGLGHWLLGKRVRAGVFAALVTASFVTGVLLHGELAVPQQNSPLSWFFTFGCLGNGVLYFIRLLWINGFDGLFSASFPYGLAGGGDPVAAGFFYGKTFLYTAGLMNLLVVLDVHDIARGDKS
jgi:Family of unknown function (DUF6677)